MVADDDEGRLGHGPDPGPCGLEFIRVALLGHVAGNQRQVGRGRMGVVEGGSGGLPVLAAEMNVGELEDTPH